MTTFDLQPHLRSDHLELRPLQPTDFNALYAVASDPLIWKQHPAHDRWKPDVFRAFFTEAIEHGGGLLAIDRKDDAVIGSSQYRNHDAAASEIEIGWTFLARSHWGRNETDRGKIHYNAEMKSLMLDHAFQFVDSVVLLIGPDNLRSRKAASNIGAVPEGSRTNPAGTESLVYRIRKHAR